jgi:cation diffusion facilitator CzcD-associated flavoprotein CzcO
MEPGLTNGQPRRASANGAGALEHAATDAPPTVAIVGSGFAGLCMAIRLQQAGVSYVLYEKTARIGGTWRDNTYPGSGCDVPSHLYSFSFAPKADWTRKFPAQAEILAYLEACVDRFGLGPNIRFNTEIAEARFDETHGRWRLRTTTGEETTAQVLVMGCGQLNRPLYPDLPGREDFAATQFHSARWRHDHDLTDRTVAVIGNGASAIQFVPIVAHQARQVFLFQRTSNWIIPKPDRPFTPRERWIFAHVPLARQLYRWAIYWRLEMRFLAFHQGSRVGRLIERGVTRTLEREIADPRLREILRPDFPVGCKRILISNDWFETMRRPNVEIVTSPITRLTRDAVVTADGASRPVDTVIYATGFQATSFLTPIRILGRGGRDLREAWREGAEAYLGVAVAGFPNLFMLYGPNTNLGHNSIIFMIECQVRYVMQCLAALRERGLAFLDVRPRAMQLYNEEVQASLQRSVWNAGCSSWYRTSAGKITNNWPYYTFQYWWRMRHPDLADYEAARGAARPPAPRDGELVFPPRPDAAATPSAGASDKLA